MPEATPEFKGRLRETFEELEVGRTFTYRRTFTEGDLAMFCGISDGYNPYLQDERFARESPFGQRTLPGLLTASMMTHTGGMLEFHATEMSFEYLVAVYPSDTVTCTVTIAEKDEEKRCITGETEFTN
jgi:3-hydroxybutyryl-CoA dehydratase